MKLENSNSLTFDLTEIMLELEIPDNKYVPLKPLQKGNRIPDLVFKNEQINQHSFLNGAGISGAALLRQIAGKPLVICFYSLEWKEYGLAHLTFLNKLQSEIRAIGGNVLIICPDEQNNKLEELVWDNSLKLNFYFDKNNEIARQLELYSELDPAWNKYPGIEVNVPLLATYIVSNGEILYSAIDQQLTGPAPSKELLQTVIETYFFMKSA
ncbi:redoxin domain-containing protein [Mucilaginibacter sp.]|uniref:redoxin domain-containing protein n=1 Tax=Mucilaginibacter sp. TaxID=1882438 RepID=UPI003D13CA31